MASRRIEFSTVRELEKKTFRIFRYGGIALVAGLLLSLVVPIVGWAVMGLAIIGVVAAMAYVSMLGKEPSRSVFCPYCACENEVYKSRRSFNCDICRRPIAVSETGEVLVTEADSTARYGA